METVRVKKRGRDSEKRVSRDKRKSEEGRGRQSEKRDSERREKRVR